MRSTGSATPCARRSVFQDSVSPGASWAKRARQALSKAEQARSQLAIALESVSYLLQEVVNVNLFDTVSANRQLGHLIRSAVELTARDVKCLPGEIHRCGLWWYYQESQELVLMFASSGFPPDYENNRRLHVDRSVAGRCFRKQEIIRYTDRSVREDADWEENPASAYRYDGLICVPISTTLSPKGVLTVDAKRLGGFSEESVRVAETYAQLVRLIQQYMALSVILADVLPGAGEAGDQA